MGSRRKKFRQRSPSRRVRRHESPFTVFLDENHARTPELLRALNLCGVSYETPDECGLSPGTPDEKIFRSIGKRGDVFLTTDKSIRRNELEIAAALQYGVTQFAFSNNNMTGPQLAVAFTTALPHLRHLVGNHPRPFVASIGKRGAVNLVADPGGRVVPPRAVKERA